MVAWQIESGRLRRSTRPSASWISGLSKSVTDDSRSGTEQGEGKGGQHSVQGPRGRKGGLGRPPSILPVLLASVHLAVRSDPAVAKPLSNLPAAKCQKLRLQCVSQCVRGGEGGPGGRRGWGVGGHLACAVWFPFFLACLAASSQGTETVRSLALWPLLKIIALALPIHLAHRACFLPSKVLPCLPFVLGISSAKHGISKEWCGSVTCRPESTVLDTP